MIFPQELINILIEFSEGDLPTLICFCLVSRACYHVARPLLYREVIAASSFNRQVVVGKKLFNAIMSNPQFASYVYEFTLHPDCYCRELSMAMPQLLDLLRETLASMIRLRKLRLIFQDGCDDEFPIDPVLVGHDFQLEEFFWRDFRWYVQQQAQLGEFLASQPRIKTLEMVSGPDATPSSFDVLPTACPNLETFSGNFLYFKALAPTRPITNFVWNGVSHVLTTVIDEMSASFSKLRVLIFHEGFPNNLDLRLLTSHLNSLEVLHLSLEDTRTAFQIYEQVQNGQKIVHHIATLTNLRAFVLTVYPLRLQFHEHTQRALTRECFSVLPRLERAYFNGFSMDPDEVLCWTRGETLKPRRTHIEEIYKMYRTDYALETALLKPFSDVSRFKRGEHSPDEQENMGDHGTQAQWWKRLLNWDTISFLAAH